jgi:hypothetical protein
MHLDPASRGRPWIVFMGLARGDYWKPRGSAQGATETVAPGSRALVIPMTTLREPGSPGAIEDAVPSPAAGSSNAPWSANSVWLVPQLNVLAG